jgi:hypothetical protein
LPFVFAAFVVAYALADGLQIKDCH